MEKLIAYIALGGNIGDREEILLSAVKKIGIAGKLKRLRKQGSCES